MRTTIVLAACLAFALVGSAHAAPRQSVNMVWMIEPMASFDPHEVTVQDGDHILKQRLVPTGLARLRVDIAVPTGNKLAASSGTQLIQAATETGLIFCALDTTRADKRGILSANTRPVTLCFSDDDRNGRFETAFEVASSPTGVVMQGSVPKQPFLVDASYEIRPNSEFKGDFWVGIRYEQYFNIYGNRMLMTDFGGRGTSQSLTSFDTFKSKGVFPRPATVLGARLTILTPDEKGVRVKLDAPMPAQPFGVVTTITYRIY